MPLSILGRQVSELMALILLALGIGAVGTSMSLEVVPEASNKKKGDKYKVSQAKATDNQDGDPKECVLYRLFGIHWIRLKAAKLFGWNV